jgi:hypothetical protein
MCLLALCWKRNQDDEKDGGDAKKTKEEEPDSKDEVKDPTEVAEAQPVQE